MKTYYYCELNGRTYTAREKEKAIRIHETRFVKLGEFKNKETAEEYAIKTGIIA